MGLYQVSSNNSPGGYKFYMGLYRENFKKSPSTYPYGLGLPNFACSFI